MTENAAEGSLRTYNGYGTLCAILAIVTLVEWVLFILRHDIPKDCLVPSFLGLSGLKFAMVVDWYVRLKGEDPGWVRKATATAFVALGGTALAFAVLLPA